MDIAGLIGQLFAVAIGAAAIVVVMRWRRVAMLSQAQEAATLHPK